jgi:hypothetical protein
VLATGTTAFIVVPASGCPVHVTPSADVAVAPLPTARYVPPACARPVTAEGNGCRPVQPAK